GRQDGHALHRTRGQGRRVGRPAPGGRQLPPGRAGVGRAGTVLVAAGLSRQPAGTRRATVTSATPAPAAGRRPFCPAARGWPRVVTWRCFPRTAGAGPDRRCPMSSELKADLYAACRNGGVSAAAEPAQARGRPTAAELSD